jgi:Holliday junction resolvase RusA-like endonuclease
MKNMHTVIMVEPTAKGRPRVSIVNGHARAYTPAKTAHAETAIAYHIRNNYVGQEGFGKDKPLSLTATFYLEKPRSASKRVKHPTHRPDLDNYVKLLLDALNKYLIPDDSQIVDMRVNKCFGTPPRIELTIKEIEEV